MTSEPPLGRDTSKEEGVREEEQGLGSSSAPVKGGVVASGEGQNGTLVG